MPSQSRVVFLSIWVFSSGISQFVLSLNRARCWGEERVVGLSLDLESGSLASLAASTAVGSLLHLS